MRVDPFTMKSGRHPRDISVQTTNYSSADLDVYLFQKCFNKDCLKTTKNIESCSKQVNLLTNPHARYPLNNANLL